MAVTERGCPDSGFEVDQLTSVCRVQGTVFGADDLSVASLIARASKYVVHLDGPPWFTTGASDNPAGQSHSNMIRGRGWLGLEVRDRVSDSLRAFAVFPPLGNRLTHAPIRSRSAEIPDRHHRPEKLPQAQLVPLAELRLHTQTRRPLGSEAALHQIGLLIVRLVHSQNRGPKRGS